MSETIFDFDLAGAGEGSDDPDNFPDGSYRGALFNARVIAYKTKPGKAVVLTFRITEGDHAKKDIDEWLSANSSDDSRTRKRLKDRLIGLGVPKERINSLTMDDLNDLVGTEVVFTKKQNGQYKNVTKVVLADGAADAVAQQNVADLL